MCASNGSEESLARLHASLSILLIKFQYPLPFLLFYWSLLIVILLSVTLWRQTCFEMARSWQQLYGYLLQHMRFHLWWQITYSSTTTLTTAFASSPHLTIRSRYRSTIWLLSFYFTVCLWQSYWSCTVSSHRLWQRKIPGNVSEARIRSAQGEKRRIVKALILIVMVFAVCWFPAHAMHYLVYYRKDIYRSIPREVEMFFFWLCHANSIINPCLYVLISPSYRKFLQGSFGRFCSCCNHANFNSLTRRSTGMLTLSRSFDATSNTVFGFSFKIKDTVETQL